MTLDNRSESLWGPTAGVDQAAVRLFEPAFTRSEIEVSPSIAPGSGEYTAGRPVTRQGTAPAQEPATAKPRNDEFVATFSHELRNALSAIHNAAHLLRLQRDESAVALKARMLIERQVGRMRRLVDDLLDITRLKSDGLCLQCERIDLRDVVTHAIETMELDMSARNHRVAISLPDAPVWLHADAGRLEQVLVNLLGNAAKYTDPGGSVAIAVQHSGAQAVVRVCDSGIGIAPELLPRVFDLYMQANPASRRAEGGLGIGLALVRRLVELHGGEVTALSTGPGQGSEFSVRLPIV